MMRLYGMAAGMLIGGILGAFGGNELAKRLPPTPPVEALESHGELMPSGRWRAHTTLRINELCGTRVYERRFRDEHPTAGVIYASPVDSSVKQALGSVFRGTLPTGTHQVWTEFDPALYPNITRGVYSLILSVADCPSGYEGTYTVALVPYDWSGLRGKPALDAQRDHK